MKKQRHGPQISRDRVSVAAGLIFLTFDVAVAFISWVLYGYPVTVFDAILFLVVIILDLGCVLANSLAVAGRSILATLAIGGILIFLTEGVPAYTLNILLNIWLRLIIEILAVMLCVRLIRRGRDRTDLLPKS